ncbi:MAG TPA: hypothetical protein VK581_05290 [Chthoniobacterales bacterium]|nr:hypothetical protein [Chthoniobacterales bacterium]
MEAGISDQGLERAASVLNAHFADELGQGDGGQVPPEMRSAECGMWNAEWRMGSAECGMRNAKCGTRKG